jgi:hypothetical protein
MIAPVLPLAVELSVVKEASVSDPTDEQKSHRRHPLVGQNRKTEHLVPTNEILISRVEEDRLGYSLALRGVSP